MVIAIASGKGGTGKTTMAVNVAVTVTRQGRPVQLLDCDVEEPNAHLFLDPRFDEVEEVTVTGPRVDLQRCDGCGECARRCEFGAIVALGGEISVFPELCHSCGGCALACPQRAITEEPRTIGTLEQARVGELAFARGVLNVGEARAVPLIAALKNRADGDALVLLDAPPGTGCPMMAAVRDCHFVCLVTEPTPFGLHDLTMAVDAVRTLHLPLGVVINRADLGDEEVRRFCQQQQIPILMELPCDRRIAEVCSRGRLIVDELPEYQEAFRDLAERIVQEAGRAPAPGGAAPAGLRDRIVEQLRHEA